jgi:protease-4
MAEEIHLTPAYSNNPSSPPPQIIIQQPRGAFGGWGKWILSALVLGAIVLMSAVSSYQAYYVPKNMPEERYHSLSKAATKKIAVIEISGPITDEEDGYVKRQIDLAREDKDVVAVVARINSPGGTVTGSDYIYHHLRELIDDRKLPLVVSMGSVCASGGYYVAMAVGAQPETIYAEPTTWTGSIGVIIPHFDLSETLSNLGVREDSIASGPLKAMGAPTRAMTEEERELFKQLVDDTFGRFKEIVTNGRPKFKEDQAALEKITTGQIFTAKQALDLGLVDKIGFEEEAIARAAELAKVDVNDVRGVEYEDKSGLFGSFMGAQARASSRGAIDVAGVIDLMTPRAYYLWTWLPAAMSSAR